MNNLKVFKNNDFGSVRTIIIDGEPYFVGKDVAQILGYSNHRKALIDHVDAEDKAVTKCDTLGGVQQITIINESGLYSLILSSKLATAKKFKRWITHEVIPEIRETGTYSVIPKDFPQALRAYADEVEKNALLKEKNKMLLEQTETLEASLNIANRFYTVAKYNKKYEMNWNMKTSQKIGKKMTAYCKGNGFEIKICETNDERFSKTNSYPLTAWENFLNENPEYDTSKNSKMAC